MSSLYVDRRGTEIRVNGGALTFHENNERIGTVPIAPLSRIYLRGDVSLKASLLGKLGEHKIGVVVLSGRKGEVSMLMGCPHNDARRRLAQYAAAQDMDCRMRVARHLVHAKLQSQIKLLEALREARPIQRHAISLKLRSLQELPARIPSCTQASSLRGIEGAAASLYFGALVEVTPPSLNFQGRNRRPPRDPLNVALSLGYTLLHAEAVLALHGCGLDPFIGFYHDLNYGRESLACDLIEPLRADIDAFSLNLFAKQQLRAEDFSMAQGACLLGKAGRQRFYALYEEMAEGLRRKLDEGITQLSALLPTPAHLAIAADAEEADSDG